MTQLIPEPRLLSFRVAPRRHHDGVPQLALRKPPREHRGRLAIPYPVEPRRVRWHACRQNPPYLVRESRGEHLLHPLSDATVQRVPRQRELNVPRPHRPGRARVLLPPAQSSPGEQRNFDGPTRPLPPTAPEPAVEARGPMGEPRRREVRRPGAQPLAPRGVERRLVEQALRQGAYVQPGPADDHRLAAAAADLPEPVRGVAREAACTVALPRLDDIETQVRHAGQQRAGRLRGADVQSPVHLTGVGGDDADGFALGPRSGDRSLADRGGADDYRNEWWVRHGQSAECGMRNAELKGEVARVATLTFTLRIPHSAFRIQLLPNLRSSSSLGS